MKYTVIETFRQPHKDCEGETQDCNTYEEALALKTEWRKQKKYKHVCIDRNDNM